MAKERVLENLILENEDFIHSGDLLVKGDVTLTNCNLIVSGTLEIAGHTHVTGGDIVCEVLDCEDIYIRDGDICVKNLSVGIIDSDGNIEVSKDSYVNDVKALNFLVYGNNDSVYIDTIQDTYIGGENDSHTITARDIFIENHCNLNNDKIIAKSFYCGGEITNCSGMYIG